MLDIKEDMVQDILWFNITGSFFFAGGGMLRCGPKICGNRAWKVSVTQRRFRKVVAKDFTDESDSSLWNLTSLLVVRRSFFFGFLLNTPCQKLEKPFEGTMCDASILCRKLWQMSATVYNRKGRSFSFMAMDSSHSKQINTAISRVQKQNRNRNHQYTQTFNLCKRSRVAQVSHTAAKVAFHNIWAFTCWIICCT